LPHFALDNPAAVVGRRNRAPGMAGLAAGLFPGRLARAQLTPAFPHAVRGRWLAGILAVLFGPPLEHGDFVFLPRKRYPVMAYAYAARYSARGADGKKAGMREAAAATAKLFGLGTFDAGTVCRRAQTADVAGLKPCIRPRLASGAAALPARGLRLWGSHQRHALKTRQEQRVVT
jgi:hypothetical protein